MGANILVATPQPAFGELLRLSLEEAGHYTVRLAQNGREAQFAASRLAFEVAILDSSLPEQAIQALVEVLRSANHGLRLVMIAPPPDSPQPSLNGLHPDATLSQPFYMPDLLEIIAGLVRRPALGALSANGKPAGKPPDLSARPPEPVLRPAAELSELLSQAA